MLAFGSLYFMFVFFILYLYRGLHFVYKKLKFLHPFIRVRIICVCVFVFLERVLRMCAPLDRVP